VKEDYKPLLALNMFGHGSSLGDRIVRILRPGREFAQASFGRIGVTATVLLLLAGIGLQGPLWVAFAQQESLPSFEVATIKPAPPFSLEKMQSGQLHVVSIKGPQADFQFVSLSDLLVYAYRVKPHQIFGPSWIRDGRWDIVAKLPKGASQDRAPEMLRSLLVERFKLAAHHESREVPAYQLVVDKGGTKFQAAPPEEDSAPNKDAPTTSSPTLPLGGFPGGGNMRFGNDGRGVITGGPNGTTRVSQAPSGGMRFEMSRMTMPALAEMLTPFLGRPVVEGSLPDNTRSSVRRHASRNSRPGRRREPTGRLCGLPRRGIWRRLWWFSRRGGRCSRSREPGSRVRPRGFVRLSVRATTRPEAPVW